MLNSFHDVNFPLPLAMSARGGPVRQTHITALSNGAELRNTSRAGSLRRYDVGAGLKTAEDLDRLVAFFEARHGQLYGFRFHDPMDFKSCGRDETITAMDQIIGRGDGVQTIFDLTKTYADEAHKWVRKITRPSGEILCAIDGNATSDFEIISGRIVFPTPPQSGAEISAGFHFDVPVRFDTPQLDISFEAFGGTQVPSIPLTEIYDER